jgi:hypothetical protein
VGHSPNDSHYGVRISNTVVLTVTLANPCASVLRSSGYSTISRKSSTTLTTQLPLISPHFEARYLLRASFPTRYSMLRLNQVLLTLSHFFSRIPRPAVSQRGGKHYPTPRRTWHGNFPLFCRTKGGSQPMAISRKEFWKEVTAESLTSIVDHPLESTETLVP